MLCRDTEKAEKTATEIRKDTGNQVEVLKLDLSSLQSVRDCAKTLLEKEEKVDILINNAGTVNKIIRFNPKSFKVVLYTVEVNSPVALLSNYCRNNDLPRMENLRWLGNANRNKSLWTLPFNRVTYSIIA